MAQPAPMYSIHDEPKVFGVPGSQPTRAVMLLLENAGLPYQLVAVPPGEKIQPAGSKLSEHLDRNPLGNIPTLEDSDGFYLFESQAILTYIAKTRGLTDVYPEDPKKQALIDIYFNYHHKNTRQISVGMVFPLLRRDLMLPPEVFQNGPKVADRVLRDFENIFLKATPFIFSDKPTIADFSAVMEISQCAPQWFDMLDFTPYPKVQAWLEAMERLPGYMSVMQKAGPVWNVVKGIVGQLKAAKMFPKLETAAPALGSKM
jgi:glutathione S-transferase